MKIITETSYDFNVMEANKGKDMYVAGIFSSAEIENNNKRRYKRDILEREVTKVNEKVKDRSLWGELGHPPNPEINPDKIAIAVTELEWKGNNLYGKAKILDTPMGNIARTLVKEGKLGISSRGLGTVAEDGYVNEDFNLITWDLVTDPSNKPSWVNGIYEGQEFQMIGTRDKEVKTDDIKKAQKAYFNHLMETIDSVLNEASKIKVQYRISPRTSKMRVVKNLDQIFKDYTKDEIRDSNIDIIVDGEVVGDISGAKLSYRVR